MTRAICCTGKVRCEHVECDGEREATEQPQRRVQAITMSTVWMVGLGALLLLCLGILLGSAWTVQAMNQQNRRIATEWRELNAARLAMQDETRLRCSWCGKPVHLTRQERLRR